MKELITQIVVVISILVLPASAAFAQTDDRTCLEGQENAQLVNARDSVQIYRYARDISRNQVVRKLPVGEQVAIVGDTTVNMLKISICDSICYVEKQYVAVDSVAFSTSQYTARNEFGLKIPLKWFFIALIVSAFANLLYYGVEYKNPFIALLLYLVMNAIFIGACLCHSFPTVVDNTWTGGWWNGYLMSFVNSFGLLLVMIANKRAYTSVAKSTAYECLSQRDYDLFSPSLLFWSILLSLIVGGLCSLINTTVGIIVGSLIFLGVFIYTLYCFGRYFLFGIFLFLLALATFAVCCLIFKILFTLTFVIGILALLVLVFGERSDFSSGVSRSYSSDSSSSSSGYVQEEKDIYIEGKGWRRGKVECMDVNVDGNYYRRGSDGEYHEI